MTWLVCILREVQRTYPCTGRRFKFFSFAKLYPCFSPVLLIRRLSAWEWKKVNSCVRFRSTTAVTIVNRAVHLSAKTAETHAGVPLADCEYKRSILALTTLSVVCQSPHHRCGSLRFKWKQMRRVIFHTNFLDFTPQGPTDKDTVVALQHLNFSPLSNGLDRPTAQQLETF